MGKAADGSMACRRSGEGSTSNHARMQMLRPYQLEGVSFLLESESALLADEMGLGKTVQAATAIEAMLQRRTCSRILIVAPRSLLLNWESELETWTSQRAVRIVEGTPDDRKAHYQLPLKVWIASYDQVRADIDVLERERPYDLVILDEAQVIKNPDALVSLACRRLRRSRSWALTGTPMENRPDDLLSIFAFLKPGLVHAGLRRAELHTRMAPHFLRRMKAAVLPEQIGRASCRERV